MWDEFIARHAPSTSVVDLPEAWHFCDNERDADECARLVMTGVKRATSPSLWSFQSSGEPLPAAGELNIVTDWSGRAMCVIRTVSVQILRFDEVTEVHAGIEGEGDGSLEWWRNAHRAYYRRELEGTGHVPQPDMPIVFQEFERVFPPAGV